jgi:hypothetical protein
MSKANYAKKVPHGVDMRSYFDQSKAENDEPEKAPSVYESYPIQELIAEATKNPAILDELSNDKLDELRRAINPYGYIVTGDESYVNISLINYKDEYLRKLLITSLVGYLYRLAYEYKPLECEELELQYDRKIGEAADAETAKALREEKERKCTEYTNTCRKIIERFLNRNFNYNPDKHIRGAHTANKDDPERKPKDELIREMCKTAKRANGVESKMKENPENTFKYMRSQTLNTYNSAQCALELTNNVIKMLDDPYTDITDKKVILTRCSQKLSGVVKDMKRVAEPLSAADCLPMVKVEPPHDVFYHYNRYITNHYEHLRDVCTALYCEKQDIEYAIIYYDHFKSEAEAREHRIKHQSEFRASTFTVSNQGITLLGPFKENRDRVDFYNKNTDILKQMMEQMELDHKLGKDLMEKSVKREKTKDIARAGLDNKGLSEYVSVMNEVRKLGAKEVLTKEDKEKLFELQRAKEQLEVPQDMIAMDVFLPIEDEATGEQKLVRDTLYTQAEEPLHLTEKDSPYAAEYQPVKITGSKPEYVNKIIKSRDGKERKVVVKGAKKSG